MTRFPVTLCTLLVGLAQVFPVAIARGDDDQKMSLAVAAPTNKDRDEAVTIIVERKVGGTKNVPVVIRKDSSAYQKYQAINDALKVALGEDNVSGNPFNDTITISGVKQRKKNSDGSLQGNAPVRFMPGETGEKDDQVKVAMGSWQGGDVYAAAGFGSACSTRPTRTATRRCSTAASSPTPARSWPRCRRAS